MEQYNFLPTDDLQPPIPDDRVNSVKIISKSFFAIFILAAVTFFVRWLIEALVIRYDPAIVESNWYIWVTTVISLIGCGFPIYCLIMRTIPDSPKREVQKIKPSAFIMFFFICVAAAYISNIFTVVLGVIISIIKGGKLVNPVAEILINESSIWAFIYAVILAPIFEELIFRKLLLNKLRRFGDLPAILLTGLAFGLFHFNLMQFFYASVLGFLFAYITIRSNTIVYSVILHMMNNFIGTVIAFFMVDNVVLLFLMLLWEITGIAVGLTFFFLNSKKIRLEWPIHLLKASAFVLNTGFILFALFSVVMIAINTIA